MVWIESITSTRAAVSAAIRRCARRPVSATSLSPSVSTPSRRARSATWRTDSSPVAYSTGWSWASAAAHCKSSVDLPMPGSPPISVTDPGTSPPPSTRSNSAKPVVQRVSGTVTSCATAAGRSPPDASRRPAPRVRGSEKGASVFHSLHDGHCPLHRGASAPQDEQTNTVRGLAIWAIRDREAAMLACKKPPTGLAGLRRRSRFRP